MSICVVGVGFQIVLTAETRSRGAPPDRVRPRGRHAGDDELAVGALARAAELADAVVSWTVRQVARTVQEGA